MGSKPKIEEALREAIIAQPDVILDDRDVMGALIAANDKIMGANIVDLRGMVMDRLETRLDRLEDTHRSVIAAAYENVAGTNQIHRAVLRLLEPEEFELFLRELNGEIAEILRVDTIRLVLETDKTERDASLDRVDDVLTMQTAGFVDAYLQRGHSGASRLVTIRQTNSKDADVYGDQAGFIQSEACLRLDLGHGRLPGLLLLGSEDPQMFTQHQGTDLLMFFTGVFERIMRRWLS